MVSAAELTANAPGGFLGNAVALNSDTAVIGAPFFAEASGTAFVFTRGGTTWTRQAQLLAPGSGVTASLGSSVAVNGDIALVGALSRDANTGAVYVYARNASSWTEQVQLLPFDASTNKLFGAAVAVNGNYAVIGEVTSAAYIFCALSPTATLTSSLTLAWPATPVTFTGSGFTPNENVHFRYDRAPRTTVFPMNTVVADGTGAFTFTTAIPVAPYGSGVIQASGQNSGKFGAVSFDIVPRLSVTPDGGSPGNVVTIDGAGYLQAEIVKLGFYSPRDTLGTVEADDNGSFSVPVTIPNNVQTGQNQIVGKDDASQALGTGRIQIN